MLTLSWSSLPFYHWLFAKRNEDQVGKKPATEAGDALIFDPKTRRYRLRQDLFDKAIADAAEVVWSAGKAKNT